MRKIQSGLLLLMAFFSFTAGAQVLWQRPLQGNGSANGLQQAENNARNQLNMQISSSQSQCQSNQGVALVFGFQKNCNHPTPFSWNCSYRVTMSCEN